MKEQEPSKKKNNGLRNVALLSGIAIEMGAIIFVFAKGGRWLDENYGGEKRLFTLLGTLLGLGISLWVVLKQLKRINN